MYPETCSGVFTLLPKNAIEDVELGSTHGVWGASEIGGERVVVDLDAVMGG